MAEARKRARRSEGTAGPPPEPKAATPAAEQVFADEPAPGEAPAAAPGERLELPSSGLAEDVLRALQSAPARSPAPSGPALPASAPAGAEKIELPASGLAEDILARPEAAPAEPATPAPRVAAEAAPVPAAGVHSLSFFSTPVREQRAAAEATEHLVTFYLDREEYGVDVRQVQEIRRVTEITSVPRAPDFVRGVINLRGKILPVLDLKRKLGLGEVAAGRTSRIVVVRLRERLLGLLVDGASQVPKIPLSRIEPPPEEVVERGGDYIRGVAKLEDRLIILVDLERLLAHELRAAGSPATGARAAETRNGIS
jgi:purine-binding chemotaxis protein CheW